MAEAAGPVAVRFAGNRGTARAHEIRHAAQAGIETVMHPYGMADDASREAGLRGPASSEAAAMPRGHQPGLTLPGTFGDLETDRFPPPALDDRNAFRDRGGGAEIRLPRFKVGRAASLEEMRVRGRPARSPTAVRRGPQAVRACDNAVQPVIWNEAAQQETRALAHPAGTSSATRRELAGSRPLRGAVADNPGRFPCVAAPDVSP
ncbi:hypothetical protein [Poseidonocella sp. HB161398]|uniref:hypothetical protein n=1 Tax=Poseidonocella sp. HB161398 TaxID=2320855 RepID=UPI00110A01F4|nr:hypothetical protein [Poseidonocella sp. HB161398]